MMSSIAVLITCYNRVKTTLKCLDLLFKNKLPKNTSIDIYLVDDNSPDKTGEIVKQHFPQVNVIKGTGKLYWNRGMLLAWQTAAKTKDYDFYLWLNDDVFLFEDAILTILNDYFFLKKQSIEAVIIGAFKELNSEKITYSGYFNGEQIIPSYVSPQKCDFFHGNFVLISNKVFKKTGFLDRKFIHRAGDFDYSFKILKKGFKCYIVSKYTGRCDKNKNKIWSDPTLPFKSRLKQFFSPKGASFFQYVYYKIKNYGVIIGLLTSIKLIIQLFFPKIFIRK